jgi:Lipid A 3-O-deacylase (PagL)
MSRKVKLISLFLIGLNFHCFGQEKKPKLQFIETEYLVGKIIPNYKDTFPSTTLQHGFHLTIGSVNTDTSSWAKYYNFPEAGVSLLYSNYGNNTNFGNVFAATPYVAFPVFNKAKPNYKLKFGLGLAYVTKTFDSISNTRNQVISSHLTWDFKLALYRNIYSAKNFNLLLGLGFLHQSNGHTKLPNLGINSALLSLSGQFYKDKSYNNTPKRVKGRNHSQKKLFLQFREGYGFHEQSPDEGPKLNRTKPVYASSIAVGYIYNSHIKLRTGVTYKFYEQYRAHLIENDVPGLSKNPNRNASAIVFYIGNEFLMSHFSIDLEFGINLYKPFYRKFNPDNAIALTLMKTIATRLGLNAYLFNTNLLPKHNFFIGANINANLARADFTEFSLGYTFLLNENK